MRKRSVQETSVDDIVRAARAAKGTFYLYFPSWDALLAAIRERIYASFDAQWTDIAPPVDNEDWWALTDRLADTFVDFTLGLEGLHGAVFHSPFAEHNPMDAGGGAAARIRMFIEAGSAAGAFAAVDAEATARLVFAVLHETVDTIAAGADRRRMVHAMKHILRATLRKDGA